MVPKEDIEQIALVAWFKYQFPRTPILAIPNGELRDSNRAKAAQRGYKLKRMGVLAGVWDLYVPPWLLWIEAKRQKGSRLSKEQIDFKDSIWDDGYSFIVAYGWEDGMRKIKLFLDKGKMQCYLN